MFELAVAYPLPGERFATEMYGSEVGIGGVFLQIRDAKEKVTAFCSNRVSRLGNNYCLTGIAMI